MRGWSMWLLAAGSFFADTGSADERRMKVTATAFNSTRAQTDPHPDRTACGVKLAPGSKIIAVSRDLMKQGLSCGTQIRIRGLAGSWKVADRTAARHQKRIDIYMGQDIQAAREWGVKKVEISWTE